MNNFDEDEDNIPSQRVLLEGDEDGLNLDTELDELGGPTEDVDLGDDEELDEEGFKKTTARMKRAEAAAEGEAHKSSIPCASFNFINSILGAGILGMPFAFSEAGFVMAILMLGLSAYLTDYSCRLLVRTGLKHNRYTYPSLVERAMGRAGYVTVGFFMFLTCIGAMVTYTTIIGDIGPVLMYRLTQTPGSFWLTRDFFILAIGLFVMLPLSLMRNISSLGKFSALATGSLLFLLSVVFANTPMVIRDKPWPEITFVSSNFFPAFGIMAFAFVCQHNSFLIFGSLKNNTARRWAVTSHTSVGFAFVVLCGVGVFGFLAFAAHPGGIHNGNLLCNLPVDAVSDVCRFLAGFVLALTFPIECFVARETLLDMMRRSRWLRARLQMGSDDGAVPSSARVHVAVTLLIVVGSTAIGWFLGSAAGIVLELTGGFSATAIAFVLPALSALLLDKESPLLSRNRIMPGLLLVFGFAGMVASTAVTVWNIATGKTNDEGCESANEFPEFNSTVATTMMNFASAALQT